MSGGLPPLAGIQRSADPCFPAAGPSTSTSVSAPAFITAAIDAFGRILFVLLFSLAGACSVLADGTVIGQARSIMVDTGYWITQKGSSAHPRRSWTPRDLLKGTPIQHFSLAVGPWAERVVQPGDRILIYWPGHGNHLFMGTFEAAGPVAYQTELPEGWSYAVPLRPRFVIADPRDGLSLDEAMALGGDPIRRFARGACARGLYRVDADAFERIEHALRPRAFAGDFQALVAEAHE